MNTSGTEPRIRIGSSRKADTAAAIAELGQAIDQTAIGLVVVFASLAYDPAVLVPALGKYFSGATVIGCSTAGEIGPTGYSDYSLTGFSIHRDDLAFEVALLEDLPVFAPRAGQRFAHDLKERLQRRKPSLVPEFSFALMLIDGLSVREEAVARAFHDGLGGIPLVGGSAGDDLAFHRTWVFHGDRCVSQAALLLVAATPFPFTTFKTQHFVSSQERLVVTAAIPEKRIVTEINGCPAAAEYARALGMNVDLLDPMAFAAHPVAVRIGNADFVRSIQRVNPDGSLTFYCAIDVGIVFMLAQGHDMLENLVALLADIERRIGTPALMLGCDCILRNLEARQLGIRERLGDLLARNNVVGFSTYGEQYGGIHVNQTLTGIAIGRGRPA